ncbi:hypothetical protein KP509_18G056000 [Ceratopteris richardii]|uniref:Senescence domain-containing protein n=1 Tax=Ceratopteris richardii TaxID=49495 RepID=A0A8T2SRR4_CERRI|nr:hypothetical protein KP509_18G056000 [Ceratopteris richardii]
MAAGDGGKLFSAPNAQVFVVRGAESALLQSGEFDLALVCSMNSRLAAVVASVGAAQWPVGKDALAAREDERSFTFTLPGALTYRLRIGAPSTAADLSELRHLLEEFSDFRMAEEQHPPSATAPPAAVPREDQTQPQLKLPMPVALVPACKISSVETSERTSGAGDGSAASAQLSRLMLRARRVSAITKVFYKSLERGAISVSDHVERVERTISTDKPQSTLALADVDAITRVLDAVETGGRALRESARSRKIAVELAGLNVQVNVDGANTGGSLRSREWTLNSLGLINLFRIITMAMHNSGSTSGSSSGHSSSSRSSGFRGLVSSSSSSPPSYSSASSSSSSSSTSVASSSSSSSPSMKSPASQSQVQGNALGDVTTATSSLQQPPLPSPSLPPVPPFFHRVGPSKCPCMPPPSAPASRAPHSASASATDAPSTLQFRIYKPRAITALPATTASFPPPPFHVRPPRFQPPPQG